MLRYKAVKINCLDFTTPVNERGGKFIKLGTQRKFVGIRTKKFC